MSLRMTRASCSCHSLSTYGLAPYRCPRGAELREEVEHIVEWTTQAITAAETLRTAPADYVRDVEESMRSSKGRSK